MTERALRDLYTWIEAHRASLITHAGALAEISGWINDPTTRPRKLLEHIEIRCTRIAFELAAALEALDRIHPREPFSDDDTDPGI